MINISLHSEYILSVFGFKVTNTFLTSFLVTVILSVLGFVFYLARQNRRNIVLNGMKVLIFELLRFTDVVTQNRELSKRVLPLIATFFLFIVAANLLALMPGFLGSFFVRTSEGNLPVLRSPNSDLTTTVSLALVSVFSIQFFSVKAFGAGGYLRRFINFSNSIRFFLGFFERYFCVCFF